eukprot:304056-Prorocentrum_lima.AAC.1
MVVALTADGRPPRVPTDTGERAKSSVRTWGSPPPSPEQLSAWETLKEQLASLRRAFALCGG